jgi:DNA-nicking Smr family endonuclease
MRRPGRKLTAEEADVWARVASTVKPLHPHRPAPARPEREEPAAVPPPPQPRRKKVVPPPPAGAPARAPQPRTVDDVQHLDGSWERRISRGTLVPDFSLDLHGSSLDQAWSRLMHGLYQAKTMGARVVLVVTGKPRPVESADRGGTRGAIRAKIVDWLAASEHASDIVAIRGAHRRHGGAGAVYVVLRKRR